MVKKGKKRITITVDEHTLKVLDARRHCKYVVDNEEYDVLVSYSDVIKFLVEIVDI